MAEQRDLTTGGRQAHRDVQVVRAWRAQGQPPAVAVDIGPDKRHSRIPALTAERPIRSDDHEAAIMRQTSPGQHAVIQRQAGAALHRIRVQGADDRQPDSFRGMTPMASHRHRYFPTPGATASPPVLRITGADTS